MIMKTFLISNVHFYINFIICVALELSSYLCFPLDISMIYGGVCGLNLTNHAIAEVNELQHGSYHFYWMMEHPFIENIDMF